MCDAAASIGFTSAAWRGELRGPSNELSDIVDRGVCLHGIPHPIVTRRLGRAGTAPSGVARGNGSAAVGGDASTRSSRGFAGSATPPSSASHVYTQQRKQALFGDDEEDDNDNGRGGGGGGRRVDSGAAAPRARIAVNAEYAARHAHNKKREELQRLEQKYVTTPLLSVHALSTGFCCYTSKHA